jgi:hypothetical protein
MPPEMHAGKRHVAVLAAPLFQLSLYIGFDAAHQIKSFTNRPEVLLFRPVSVIIAASTN